MTIITATLLQRPPRRAFVPAVRLFGSGAARPAGVALASASGS